MTPEDDPFGSAHQLGIIHVFLQWLVRRSRGLNGRITVTTVERKWQELQRLTKLRCNHTYTAILLFLYQGLRPGEFTECSSLRGKNQGFIYGDFALMLLPQPAGCESRWVLRVTIRNRKNHRGVEKDE